MKTRINIGLLGVVIGLAAQPVAAQRPHQNTRPDGRLDADLIMRLTDDLDVFVAEIELNAQQQTQVQELVSDFTAEHQETLDRVAAIRDSLGERRAPRRRGNLDRELFFEYQGLLRELRPAFAAFENELADMLTWNQGQKLVQNQSRSARHGQRRPRMRGNDRNNWRQSPGWRQGDRMRPPPSFRR